MSMKKTNLYKILNIHNVNPSITDCVLYLCDFHREQSWERWVKAHKNGVASQKDQVLASLRRVAHSTTPELYKKALDDLYATEIWQSNAKLRVWFSSHWLPEHKVGLPNFNLCIQ